MTAEEFCNTFTPTGKTWQENFHQTMIEFAKLHVTEALKAVSKNIKLMENMRSTGEVIKNPFDKNCDFYINEQSILTAYPLDLIK
jgi:hypothetical protein